MGQWFAFIVFLNGVEAGYSDELYWLTPDDAYKVRYINVSSTTKVNT